VRIEPAVRGDFAWAEDEVAPEWGRLVDAQGLVAVDRVGLHDENVGMAVFRDGELTWLWVDRWHLHRGIATALVGAIDGPLRVTITNDQLSALRFFQRRGFRLTGAKTMAFDRPRRSGYYGIDVRDQLHLARVDRG
jgi:ribosomal protein S18 acetylase RimI-like enzyme